MKTAFLINPKIRNFSKIKLEIEKEFKDFEFQIFLSEYAGHFLEITREVARNDFKNIVAVGGDGTINEVVNGIIKSYRTDEEYNWQKISEINLGILPSGSGNDFVKNFDSKFDLKSLKENILNSNKQLIDVGKMNFLDKNNLHIERFFINITDLGMGAETMIVKEKIPVSFGANFRYFYSILSTLITYRKKVVKVNSNDFNWNGKVLNFVIANGKFFGNGLGISPEAKVNDGLFEITVVGNITLLDYALNIGKVKKSQKLKHSKVFYYKTSELEVFSPKDEKLPIDLDGEVAGFAPVKLKCLQQRISLLV